MRSAGIALVVSAVLGTAAVLVFAGAWEGGVDDGWGFGASDRPLLHGGGIALGVVWLAVHVRAAVLLHGALDPAVATLTRTGVVLTALGALAGLGVAGLQVYLLAELNPAVGAADGIEVVQVFERLSALESESGLLVLAAAFCLALGLSALAFAAARTRMGFVPAAWTLAALPLPAAFLDWIGLLYPTAMIVFGVSLGRERRVTSRR